MWAGLRKWLLKITYPLTEKIGKVYAPFSRKKITSKDYRYLTTILKPGMVLITKTNGEFANWFIPGFWSHAGLFCGGRTVIEATSKGVVKTDLIDFCLTKDYINILKPDFADEDQMKTAAEWARYQVGKPYDLHFDKTNDAFYCSELVFLSYSNTMGGLPYELPTTWGVETVTPQDLADSKHWPQVSSLPLSLA